MHAKLKVLSGPASGATIPVLHGKLLVGREEDCQVRLESEFVSRHHCVLLMDDYTVRIRDLGSKNGTFVNNNRVGTHETILSSGDIVSIGEMVCYIEFSTPETATETSPAAQVQHG
jgi:pSer/pThr/pTyr-binding forkhead associated (FHA) protein